MKNISSFTRALLLFSVLCCTQMNAAVESVISSLAGVLPTHITGNATIVLQDQWYPFPSGWNSIFRVKEATANVVLRYDDHLRTFTNSAWTLEVIYDIETYNASGSSTVTTGESVKITYDPREGINYIDRDMKQYSNAHKAILTVKTVKYNEWAPAGGTQTVTNSPVVPTWLNDIYLDLEINVERFYNLSTASAPTMYTNYNSSKNELDASWTYVQGAESYDLEWLFIDVGSVSYPFTSSYNYDWSNASHVNVPGQHYSVPLAFSKGILLLRVRGVGIDWDNYVNNTYITRGEGTWTSTAQTGTTSSYSGMRYDIQTGLLPAMNWAYSAGFAEDGVRMDGAQFYDGMMRGREAVSTVNSNNQVIVGGGAYDFEGRPAVSYLPYPATNAGIKYYGGNAAYNCQSFDQDDNIGSPAGMATSSGSGKYYSTSTTASGMDGSTPDANGFPYSRVTYMSDGTNRPATSAAAGSDLNEGSGRITQYFYGTPSQVQLDRLFGNEAGYATHYKKNFSVDPNGVVSVAYIDQHGRVVATALAGNAPSNLVAIDNPNGNPNTSVALTDDLLVNNAQRTDGTGTESEFTLTVTESSQHDFIYNVGSVTYCGDGCYTTCESCKYDLVITVENAVTGDSIDVNGVSSGYAQRFSNIASGSYTFSLTLTPGTYRVTKALTLNQATLNGLRQTYINYQTGHPGTGCLDLIPSTPAGCAGNCDDACVNHYRRGTSPNYTYVDDNGASLTTQQGLDAIAACQLQLCDQPALPDECQLKYNAMIEEMSPGGQYFDDLPDKFGTNTTTGMQTINSEYNINAWLQTSHSTAMLAAINAVWSGPDFTNWNDVRTNWSPAFATAIVEWHPEYCAWNYFCNWSCVYTEPGTSNTYTFTSTSSHTYERETIYETDGNYSGTDGYYWNPLNEATSTTHNYSGSNRGYLPYGGTNTQHLDPRFAGGCDIVICDAGSVSGESKMSDLMHDFYPAYDNNNNFIGYYSLWYVALDPDNIAGNQYSTLSQGVLDFFTQLHGTNGLISSTPSSSQVTPYQFFRSVYFYYRSLIIEQGFANSSSVATCQSTHANSSTFYDADGYLLASANNPALSTQGFTILYPRNPVIDIYGDGCNFPSMASIASSLNTMVNNAAANPDNINNPVPTDGTCSCQMLRDYVSSRGLDSTNYTAIATQLNNELGGSTYTSTVVEAWYTECHTSDPSLADLTSFPAALACNPPGPINDIGAAVLSNCQQENATLANFNANVMYQNQLEAAANAYMAGYVNRCISAATETFTVNYNLHEYYYTLYYYDQAGNLVKTVPPEGVNIILSTDDRDADGRTDFAEIKQYRIDFKNGTTTTGYDFTPGVHDMKSLYAYNSLQQPINAKQNNQGNGSTYESGTTSFWYDYLGRLVVSQNSKQAAMSPKAYSYTVYDDLGRISEVGEIHTTATLTTTASTSGSRDNSGQYYYYNINHSTSPTALDAFLNSTGSTRNDVTYTYYDAAWSGTSGDASGAFGAAGQQNLRNRVSAVVYDDDPNNVHNLYAFSVSGQPGHLNAYFYSYDVHGNVKAVVQETPPLKTHNQNIKTTTYQYDLVSGNVNQVHYQSGQRDEYHYKYEYDADNRLHASYSSRDGKTWEKDSKQFYYATGGLGRMEIGQVQGLDYVYTINGWIKGMNRNTIGNNGQYMARDLGKDANTSSTNLNQNFGADAAGFTLDYFAGDYAAINSTTAFQATESSTAYGSAIAAQYNGNIAGMVTAMMDYTQMGISEQGRVFSYDQLYRIKQSQSFLMSGTEQTNNAWAASYTQNHKFEENFTYDWNGNIKSVQRYTGDMSMGSAVMSDDLTYNYGTNSNLLTSINDTKNACSYSDDLDDQGANNYTYDEIGELKGDVSERITNTIPQSIEWNPYGKIKAVHKDQANNTNSCTSTEYADNDIEYLYTASQQRLCKIVKPHKTGGTGIADQDQWTYTWYAYDAGGQLMDVYEQTYEDLTGGNWKIHFDVKEQQVYGSGRVGVRNGDDEGKYYQQFSGTKSGGMFNSISYTGSSSAYSKTHYSRTLGLKQYSESDHLGNVQVTVSDKRLPYSSTPSTATSVDYYLPDVISNASYYCFGSLEPGRSGGTQGRWGFNGKENDNEIHNVQGSAQDYGMRMYDNRVGRFFSSDPLRFEYSYLSPYQFAEDGPISNIDLDGLEGYPVNPDGSPIPAPKNSQILTINGQSWVSVENPGDKGSWTWHYIGQMGTAQGSSGGHLAAGKSGSSANNSSSGNASGPVASLPSKEINHVSTADPSINLIDPSSVQVLSDNTGGTVRDPYISPQDKANIAYSNNLSAQYHAWLAQENASNLRYQQNDYGYLIGSCRYYLGQGDQVADYYGYIAMKGVANCIPTVAAVNIGHGFSDGHDIYGDKMGGMDYVMSGVSILGFGEFRSITSVSRNSLRYVGESHVYRIIDKSTGEVFKYGISSVPLNSSGQLMRLERQLTLLNHLQPERYAGKVLCKFGTRAEALYWENYMTTLYKFNGPTGFIPRGMYRPLGNLWTNGVIR